MQAIRTSGGGPRKRLAPATTIGSREERHQRHVASPTSLQHNRYATGCNEGHTYELVTSADANASIAAIHAVHACKCSVRLMHSNPCRPCGNVATCHLHDMQSVLAALLLPQQQPIIPARIHPEVNDRAKWSTRPVPIQAGSSNILLTYTTCC